MTCDLWPVTFKRNLPIDKRLVTKIQELVCAGARSEKEIRRHLKIYVQLELYRGQMAAHRTNWRFFPSKATIRNHIYKSVTKERFSKIDQEDLLYTTSHLHEVSFDFARIFSLVFRTSNFWILRNLITETIIPFALVGYETGYSQFGATRLVGYLPSHIQRAPME